MSTSRPDPRAELKDFLTSRRARLSPQMVGLPLVAGRRRVPGLRREEVAMLAGVSVDYYTRLERGKMAGASQEVLDSLSAALQLSDAEHQHLLDLAQAVTPSGRTRNRHRRTTPPQVRPGTQWILDAMPAPALVQDTLGTYVATNLMARALYSPLFLDPAPQLAGLPPSMARFVFLDPRSHDFFPNWRRSAEDLVAMLRLAAGASPASSALQALVGELSTHSRDFVDLWARHDVRYVCRGQKVLNHPVVGELRLAYEPTTMVSAPGLRLTVYGVEPGSASEERMRLLASWAATGQSQGREAAAPVRP